MVTMKSMRRKSGQGMTEYIVIVALVAVGAILIVTLFGTQIKEVFHRITGTVGGQDTTEQTSKQNTQSADKEASNKRHMDEFDKGQNQGK